MSTTRPDSEAIAQLGRGFTAIKPILDHYRHVLALKSSPTARRCADAALMEQAVTSAKALYDAAAAPVNAALRMYFGVELLDAVRVTMTHSGFASSYIVEELRLKSGRYGMSFHGRVVRVDGSVGVKTQDLTIWSPDNESISCIENLNRRPLEAVR